MNERVSSEAWLEVIRHAPLVSIDLVLRDAQNRVLLGWRTNRPAQHCWFVPGCAIRKNETLDRAFTRLAHEELGLQLSRSDARFLGVYEHHYADNFKGEPGLRTHYVVLSHELRVEAFPEDMPLEQHAELRAFSVDELLASPEVHEHTKAYFR